MSTVGEALSFASGVGLWKAPVNAMVVPWRSDDLRLAQVVPGRVFIDESGQFRRPRPGQPTEVGVVAGFSLPDTERDVQRLVSLVATLRRRVFGSADCREPLKARLLGPEDYELIGREMRNGWIFGYRAARYTGEELCSIEETLSNLEKAVEIKRSDLRAARSLDLRLDFLQRQCRSAARKHPIYMMLLVNFYLATAGWFRQQNIVPKLRVWIDDRLDRADHEIHGFLGRLGIWTTFPEVYSNRLGSLLGIDADTDFSCSVSSDQEQDGLIIADSIAYAAGMISRGQDESGQHQRALDALRTSS